MKEILFKLGLFHSEASRPASERVLAKALDLLFTADVEFLRANPNTPDIYTPGLMRYEREPLEGEQWDMIVVNTPTGPRSAVCPRNPEEWKAIPYCIEDGFADCEDLACWLAAQRLVRQGIECRPAFSFRNVGRMSIYHIVCRHPDGTIEDPSRVLGMV